MRAHSFSSFSGSSTSNARNEVIDTVNVPLAADNVNELAHSPIPRGTPELPAELEPDIASRPVIPPRNPKRVARQFSSGMRETLDPSEEG